MASRVRINLRGRVPAPVDSQSAVWPEGVFARYGTGMGATVDLTHMAVAEDAKATLATCTGCEGSETAKWASQYAGSHGYIDFQDRPKGDRKARAWAQAHAEKCRALPKPTGVA